MSQKSQLQILARQSEQIHRIMSGLSQEMEALGVDETRIVTTQEVDEALLDYPSSQEESAQVHPSEAILAIADNSGGESSAPVVTRQTSTGVAITRACKHKEICFRIPLLASGKHRGFCTDANGKMIRDDVQMDDETAPPTKKARVSRKGKAGNIGRASAKERAWLVETRKKAYAMLKEADEVEKALNGD